MSKKSPAIVPPLPPPGLENSVHLWYEFLDYLMLSVRKGTFIYMGDELEALLDLQQTFVEQGRDTPFDDSARSYANSFVSDAVHSLIQGGRGGFHSISTQNSISLKDSGSSVISSSSSQGSSNSSSNRNSERILRFNSRVKVAALPKEELAYAAKARKGTCWGQAPSSDVLWNGVENKFWETELDPAELREVLIQKQNLELDNFLDLVSEFYDVKFQNGKHTSAKILSKESRSLLQAVSEDNIDMDGVKTLDYNVIAAKNRFSGVIWQAVFSEHIKELIQLYRGKTLYPRKTSSNLAPPPGLGLDDSLEHLLNTASKEKKINRVSSLQLPMHSSSSYNNNNNNASLSGVKQQRHRAQSTN